jgi:hypothetical protein
MDIKPEHIIEPEYFRSGETWKELLSKVSTCDVNGKPLIDTNQVGGDPELLILLAGQVSDVLYIRLPTIVISKIENNQIYQQNRSATSLSFFSWDEMINFLQNSKYNITIFSIEWIDFFSNYKLRCFLQCNIVKMRQEKIDILIS